MSIRLLPWISLLLGRFLLLVFILFSCLIWGLRPTRRRGLAIIYRLGSTASSWWLLRGRLRAPTDDGCSVDAFELWRDFFFFRSLSSGDFVRCLWFDDDGDPGLCLDFDDDVDLCFVFDGETIAADDFTREWGDDDVPVFLFFFFALVVLSAAVVVEMLVLFICFFLCLAMVIFNADDEMIRWGCWELWLILSCFYGSTFDQRYT